MGLTCGDYKHLLTAKAIARFYRYVDKQVDHWLWTGATFGGSNGTARFKLGYDAVPAARVAYVIYHNAIDDLLMVLHTCDIPRCMKPSHLYQGTNTQNMRDMVDRGRSLRGERHPQAKLATATVRAIRSLYATGEVSQQEIADSLGVNQTLIGFIVRNKIWLDARGQKSSTVTPTNS